MTEIHPAAASGGADRASRVRAMFAGIAPRYELVNSIASAGLDRPWRRDVVRALALRPGDWCLDACCGTGDLSRAVAAAGARVLGADFCRPMLERAAGTSGVGLVEADALALPVRDGAFDGACVAFGLRNLADPQRGLRELARCVRPGGRVVVLEFSEPESALLRAAYRFYSRRVLPLIGDAISGRWGTYRYLPQTIGVWMSPPELSRAMEDAGLRDVGWRLLTGGIAAIHVGTKPAG